MSMRVRKVGGPNRPWSTAGGPGTLNVPVVVTSSTNVVGQRSFTGRHLTPRPSLGDRGDIVLSTGIGE